MLKMSCVAALEGWRRMEEEVTAKAWENENHSARWWFVKGMHLLGAVMCDAERILQLQSHCGAFKVSCML